MNIAYYSAVSGLQAFQAQLDATANNMANANTIGYKPLKASFDDLLYTQMDVKTQGEHMIGHGVRGVGMETVFAQGLFERTDRELDFAVSGTGYFAVDNGGDRPVYTRDGAFQISSTPEGNFLTTRNGDYVLDSNGNRIALAYQTIEDENGNPVPGTGLDLTGLSTRIGLYTCEYPSGLIPLGKNLYGTSPNSGQWAPVAMQTEGNKILSGALELSRTDVTDEMVNLIQAQRAFQLNSRIVTTADQMEEFVNNLR